MKVAIIGNGNMAFAIAQGLVDDYFIEVVGRNRDKLEDFRNRLGESIVIEDINNFSLEGKTVILATKPNNLDDVGKRVVGKADVLYSVLAGTPIERLKANIDSSSYVRAMPNLSAIYQASMTSLTGDEVAKERAIDLFAYIGETIWFDTENELDIATAIAGSGPAYLSLIAEALADGGVYAGLRRADAQRVVEGLFAGFSPLLQGENPAVIKDGVMSAKGTTAYGYKALENGKVRATVIKAVEKAYNRAVKLRKA
jgi:pyrroline-5-carboxylate reductase